MAAGETEGAIRVEVVYSRRRTLGLEVRADGRVILRAPKGLSNQAVMDFVKERQAWIVQKWFETERIRRQKAERRPGIMSRIRPWRPSTGKRPEGGLPSGPPILRRKWAWIMGALPSKRQRPAGEAAAPREI